MPLPFPPLPIDDLLPDLKRALSGHSAVVLQAEPGAGKTTRVPLALLNEPWLADRRIWMLEPRRLAAGNAARYMSGCLGEEVGATVGFAIRFERRVSAITRIEVMTEGILTRRLQSDPFLEGVGLVIFDEFHERHLDSDLALALCRDIQQGLRPDLKLLVMSATLDAEPVARLLGGAPLLSTQGRSFPVTVRYLSQTPQQPVAEYTAAAVRRALVEGEGDILVFLPGVGDILRCRDRLKTGPGLDATDIIPLYGDLPFADQERALLPGKRRKVVLATNIAETSLTIEGVTTVIDCGFMRRPRFDPASGLQYLDTVRVSQANAVQRAGRAGRLGPGNCVRLWTEAQHGALLPFASPEIRSADLTPLALELIRWGVDANQLSWLDPPSEDALRRSRELLQTLGALDEKGRITAEGEAMAALPVHPRLAALLLAAQGHNVLPLGCDLAALLGERDLLAQRKRASHRTSCDMLERIELLAGWRDKTSGRRENRDLDACRSVDRDARFLRRQFSLADKDISGQQDKDIIALLLAAAYPDRIGRRREGAVDRYHLSGGQGGQLSPRSGLRDAEFLVAVNMTGGRRGDGLIHIASTLDPALVENFFASRIKWRRRVSWDREQDRVVACEERRLGAVCLAARPISANPEETVPALLDGLRLLGLETLNWKPGTVQLINRVKFLAREMADGWPDFSPAGLLSELENRLKPFLSGLRSRADLSRFDPLPALMACLDWQRQRQLERLAPSHLEVPSGHRILLDYPAEGPPVLAVKLQEVFGLAETPRVADGRVAVLIHLLSPARRPVAVTADLHSFWNTVYPEVKKELAGRYPKHPWPDDPWRALPTRSVKRRP